MKLNWSAAAHIEAEATLQGWSGSIVNVLPGFADKYVLPQGRIARAIVRTMLDADTLVMLLEQKAAPTGLLEAILSTDWIMSAPTCGDKRARAKALGREAGALYRAAEQSCLELYRNVRRVKAPAPSSPLPGLGLAPGIIVALTVVGVAALAAGSWLGAEAVEEHEETVREVESARAVAVHQVQRDIAAAQIAAASGQPIVLPPFAAALADRAERSSGPWPYLAAGGALATGGLGGYLVRDRRAATPER